MSKMIQNKYPRVLGRLGDFLMRYSGYDTIAICDEGLKVPTGDVSDEQYKTFCEEAAALADLSDVHFNEFDGALPRGDRKNDILIEEAIISVTLFTIYCDVFNTDGGFDHTEWQPTTYDDVYRSFQEKMAFLDKKEHGHVMFTVSHFDDRAMCFLRGINARKLSAAENVFRNELPGLGGARYFMETVLGVSDEEAWKEADLFYPEWVYRHVCK